jgi:formate C-acetyltransferase
MGGYPKGFKIEDESSSTVEWAWRGFKGASWRVGVEVRDFIVDNYVPYEGGSEFLKGPSAKTVELMRDVDGLLSQERKAGGVLDVSAEVGSSIVSHEPGYINKVNEVVVGLQTDAPLRRAIFPNGGIKMVETGLKEYGFPEMAGAIKEIYSNYRKSHNDGVFDVYSEDALAARKNGLITGLPDSYGRGRLIGDFRRVALYGVDALIKVKAEDKKKLDRVPFGDEVIRSREELSEQIRALGELKTMALGYGFDISGPARDAKEAFQWLYCAYLAAAKQGNGAATSLGRIAAFLDVYIERDQAEGVLDELGAQELWDQLTIKLRMVRFLRTAQFDALFSGDPTWVTATVGGMCEDGRPMCTKSCMRLLHGLRNLGPSPEPNLTVLWSPELPEAFKDFVAKTAIETSAIQVESDDAIRVTQGDDAAISCCVSPMAVGRSMQFFGARCNLLKALLYAVNGGRDEVSGARVAQGFEPIQGEYLDYQDVKERFEAMMEWVAPVYVNALNAIHYMHDKYAYESIQFALHDTGHEKTLACGIAGLSYVADALSAIKYGKIRVVRDASGLAVDYVNEGGEFPRYGNNDDRVDELAQWASRAFMAALRKNRAYKDAIITQSALTITSNVVYGKATGADPSGRRAGEPFAPGANPSNGKDQKGFVAAGFSVAKIPFEDCADGISWTFSIVPAALGKTEEDRRSNLCSFIDGFSGRGGYHLNINVMRSETLREAMEDPERYPNLCVRVSGYCVLFCRLTREQQLDVVGRTFHERM